MGIRKVGRREALGVMGAAGAAMAFGCGGSPTSPDTSASATTTTASTNAACAVTPAETAGPFPSLTDLFRSDIRDGKTGTLLTLGVKVVNVKPRARRWPTPTWKSGIATAGNYSEYGTQAAQTTCEASRPRTATAR